MINVDLIVGAVIGLCVSIITSLIAHRLEMARNNQSRKWQIEDRQYSQKNEVMKERIDQAKTIINRLRDAFVVALKVEVGLIAETKQYSAEDLRNLVFSDNFINLSKVFNNIQDSTQLNSENIYLEHHTKVNEISSTVFDAIKSLTIILAFEDANLTSEFQKIVYATSNEIGNIKRLASIIEKKENIEIYTEGSRIQKSLADVLVIHGGILRGLEEKRVV